MADGKRRRSEEIEPSLEKSSGNRKRRRVSETESSPTTRYSHLRKVFDYPEVFLNILSFLTATDLAQFERVNRYWKRICTDQWLWKRIYLARYPYPTGRQQRILESSSNSSQIAPQLAGLSQSLSSDEDVTSVQSSIIGLDRLSPDENHSQRHTAHYSSASLSQQDDIESQPFSRPRIDWKLLTKIGTNWETGTAAQYSLSPSPSPAPGFARRHPSTVGDTPTKVSRHLPPGLSDAPRPIPAVGSTSTPREAHRDGRHLLELSPSFIFVSYPDSPLLHVHSSQSDIEVHGEQAKQDLPLALIPPPPGWSSPSRPDYITCIKVDSNDPIAQAPSSTRRGPVRLVVFYLSGGFVVLSVNLDSAPALTSRKPRVMWTRLVVYAPTDVSRRARRSAYSRQRGDSTVLCELQSPVLVSCTERFYISVWRLPDLDADVSTMDAAAAHRRPILLQTLHSPVSFHPAALSLKHLPRNDKELDGGDARKESRNRPEAYRASLAYSVPLYPERWTAAVQDINITIPLDDASGNVECGECLHVARSVMPGTKFLRNRWPLLPRSEIVGVKGDRAIGIGLGDTCCVLAGSDNQIQVYQLPDRSPEQDTAASNRWQPPHTASATRREIRHAQTLLAHSSAITAIALNDGRCVSAGNDGRILVWQVDRAADVLPAEGGELEAEEAEELDQGGWVSVRPVSSCKSAEYGSGPTWSHVEVRTPRKSGPADASQRKRRNMDPPASPLARPIASSSSTTLHQQFLPVPPVTHPLSLASAAREYLISPGVSKISTDPAERRAQEEERASRIVEQLAFNEERIVGLVRGREGSIAVKGEVARSANSVIKVWSFDA
ncbi:hypothetical protein NliqN6_1520 [Naganishia liquefaciens]|uniref:F-box domain-containing protein n=1 Tax=Naganishia liquefaciens TaxID=104408 RepID=A0A8H3YDD9_9TREE|nr:hypothetical protein NliqN6_1520 [Naganishia liquefaciens]